MGRVKITVDGKDVEEPSIRSDGFFAENLSPGDMKAKMRTFPMKR